jgi:spore coat polysaccharide biosynthesis protein SpsF
MFRAGQKIVGILQARMGSTRLPGKVLAPILGRPLLARLLERIRPARLVDQWIVAATHLPPDDAVESLVAQMGFPCFRGHPDDCLDRYYQAASTYSASHIVRVTGDNPLVDAGFVDWVVEQYLASDPRCDYAASSLSRTFPVGLSAEVFSFESLAAAWREDASETREHVTPYIYMNPQRFRVCPLRAERDYSSLRWTVDTPEDLEFVRSVFEFFDRADFTWQEALEAVLAHPEWSAKNAHVSQRTI